VATVLARALLGVRDRSGRLLLDHRHPDAPDDVADEVEHQGGDHDRHSDPQMRQQ